MQELYIVLIVLSFLSLFFVGKKLNDKKERYLISNGVFSAETAASAFMFELTNEEP